MQNSFELKGRKNMGDTVVNTVTVLVAECPKGMGAGSSRAGGHSSST